MDEYIEREAAIRCVANQCVDGKMWGNEETEGTLVDAYELMDDLSDIPSADVAPVRHGRKIEEGDTGCFWLCSLCGKCLPYGANYCPKCGAKIEGKTEGSDG